MPSMVKIDPFDGQNVERRKHGNVSLNHGKLEKPFFQSGLAGEAQSHGSARYTK